MRCGICQGRRDSIRAAARAIKVVPGRSAPNGPPGVASDLKKQPLDNCDDDYCPCGRLLPVILGQELDVVGESSGQVDDDADGSLGQVDEDDDESLGQIPDSSAS
jgi:hypothetical protein